MTTALSVPCPVLVLRYGELWLKGRNRGSFLDRLRSAINRSLAHAAPGARLSGGRGRLLVRLADARHAAAAAAACAEIPGLVTVCIAHEVAPELEIISETALRLARETWSAAPGPFAVRARRADKHFPMASPQINAHLGALIARETGRGVDLTQPTHTLGVDIDAERAWVSADQRAGPGGLPVGSAGRAMLLLSGGLDSPVAGHLAQRRGCELEAVYFHSPPYVSEGARDKVLELADRLARPQGALWLNVVPFTDIQVAIREAADPRLTVILYRRFMYRIAARLAERNACLALCTGESLGQVASQTLENLTVVDRLTDLLTLRPLIGWDKTEIMDTARRLGTFDISTRPFEDCCTLFVPQHPATNATPAWVERSEARLDVDALVEAALAGCERLRRPAGVPVTKTKAPTDG